MDFDLYEDEEEKKAFEERLRQKEIERQLAEEKLDLDYVMQTENGRRFVYRILEHCGLYHDIDFKDNTHLAAKQAGRRSAGLWLLGVLTATHAESYFKMQLEAYGAQLIIEEELEDVRERNRDNDDRDDDRDEQRTDLDRFV